MTDRNLLVGILALQLNFITQDELVAAMNQWLLQKQTPLADLLPMDAESRQLLQALVKKHLARHGDDPQKSLAALSSAVFVKTALQEIRDNDVQASLGHVGSGTIPQTHPHPSQDASLRFRILRPHARGGLGEVFVAEDTELRRQVALKEIQKHRAVEANSRGRFIFEAEVTGGLEHPNIVPVYGLGCYGDGRPYYAMRFIRGDSLKQAIENFHRDTFASDSERVLAFRNLLKRFVDVCNAMAYAHSRGILHRDLKPGNIMLGKYGETLVVDWGLAKSLDPTRDPEIGSSTVAIDEPALKLTSGSYAETVHGQAVGTPVFMSPEQARGELDRLGPATDVYSLGATLYVLVTGKLPFDGDVVDILTNVQAGRFAPPKQIKPDVPASLNAIVLKAMAKNPADRYATPTELAADIEHDLADEPVAAFAEPVSVRVRRWARKHPGVVAGLAAALIVGLAGLGAGLYFVNAEKAQTELARQDEAKQKLLAQANEEKANSARDAARLRYQLALDAFNEMVHGIQNKLSVHSGTLALRKDLLENARKGLKSLLTEAERQGSPDSTLVSSYLRMGDVELLLGDVGAAEREYRAGHALAETLAADPKDLKAQRNLSVSYEKIGDVNLRLNQPTQALDAYTKCLSIREKLAADSKDEQTQRDLGIGYENLGNVHLRLNRPVKALSDFRKSLAIHEKLAADLKDANAQRSLGVCYIRLVDVHLRLNQLDEALHASRKNLAIFEKLAADLKTAQAQRELSISYERLGEMHLRLHQPAEALEAFQKGLPIAEKLAADPNNSQAQRDLSLSYEKIGNAHLHLGQTTAALAAFGKSLAITEKRAADPKDAQAQRDLKFTYDRLGNVHLARDKPSEALAAFSKSLAITEKLATDLQDAQTQRDLHVGYSQIGDVQMRMNRAAEALAAYGKSQAICEKLAADPKDAQAQRDLSICYDRLGDAHLRMNQPTEALAAGRKSLALREKLAVDPKDTAAQHELSVCYAKLGDTHLKLNQLTEAIAAYRKYHAIAETIATDPKDAMLQYNLASAKNRFGASLLKNQQAAEAGKMFQDALKIALDLFQHDARNNDYRVLLNVTYTSLGNHAMKVGEFAKASDYYLQATQILLK